VTRKGTGRAIVEQDSVKLLPNTTIVIPAQATRQMVNIGEEDLVILVIRSLVPPGKKRCWRYWKAGGDAGRHHTRRFLNPAQEESHDTFYDPTVITGPKTFHLQSISILLGLKDACHSRR
jgi:hypothetical protein